MKKLISIIATSAILLNSLVTPLSILAQETPTPEPTPASIDSPQPSAEAVEATIAPMEQSTPTPIPEATAAPIVLQELSAEEVLPVETEPQVAESSATLVVSEPQPVEKVYLSDSQNIIDTVSTDWDIDEVNGN